MNTRSTCCEQLVTWHTTWAQESAGIEYTRTSVENTHWCNKKWHGATLKKRQIARTKRSKSRSVCAQFGHRALVVAVGVHEDAVRSGHSRCRRLDQVEVDRGCLVVESNGSHAVNIALLRWNKQRQFISGASPKHAPPSMCQQCGSTCTRKVLQCYHSTGNGSR